jgi:hypothetical protein
VRENPVFDTLAAELRPFLGVAVLAVLFLAISSLVHKYRLWQAEKMRRADRLLRGAGRIEQALSQLEPFGVPRELVEVCKAELLARYQEVQKLFPKLDGLAERLRRIEQGPRTDALTRNWSVPELASPAQLNSYNKGLTALVEFFAHETPQSELDAATRKTLREHLRTLRAEAYFTVLARLVVTSAENGDWTLAQNQAAQLLGFLRAKAPPTERGKGLYADASALAHRVQQHQVPGSDAATPGRAHAA